MTKIAGALLVIGATSLWGVLAAERMRNQYAQLRYLQRIFLLLQGEIRYARSYLGEAFYQIGTTLRDPYRGWLEELCRRMESRNQGSFCEIWEAAADQYLADCGIGEGALGKLRRLGTQLGAADVEMQVKALDLYLEELSAEMEELQGEMRTKIRLCHCLGVMSGIFVTVLLL